MGHENTSSSFNPVIFTLGLKMTSSYGSLKMMSSHGNLPVSDPSHSEFPIEFSYCSGKVN